jgi:glycosyltransferase involved in cell wall biosynthesis
VRWTLVGPTFPYKGGVAQHTTELAHRLTKRADIATIHSWKRQYPRWFYPGEPFVTARENPEFSRVRRDLSWNRPDGWHVVGKSAGRASDVVVLALVTPVQFPAYLVLSRAARRAGARVIAIAHNVLPHESRRFDRRLTRTLYRQLDGLVVHSESERSLAHELGAANVVVASLPFFFAPLSRVPGPRERTDTLSFAGFVRPYKGLDVLLEALARADARPRLRVRGEFWDDVNTYRELAARLGVADRCDFGHGYASTDELAATIASSDALVLPYKSATGTVFPRIAHALGVPTIVTDVGTMSQQVRHGVDGLVVPPNDPAELARAIDELYSADVLQHLSSNVRAPNVDAEWEQYLEALDELTADDRIKPARR